MNSPFEFLTAVGAAVACAVNAAAVALSGALVLDAPARRVAAIEQVVEKAQARAQRLGVEPLRYAVLGSRLVVRSEYDRSGYPTGRVRHIEYATLAFWGAAPRVAGHTLLARIEHTEAGNLVTRSPLAVSTSIDLTAYRTVSQRCEHCDLRRNRKDTFLLSTPEGTIRQVGRTCLQDFLRSEDVAHGLALWGLLDEIVACGKDDDGESGGGRGYHAPTTLEYLAHAVAAIRVAGFHRSGYPGATVDTVQFALNRCPPGQDPDWQALQPTAEDVTRAEIVKSWAAAQTGASDYEHNLRVACSLLLVGRSHGLLASAPVAYARHIEKLVAVRKTMTPSAHVGQIGKRSSFGDLIVIRTRTTESAYGTTTIVALEDAAGNRLTWFASGVKSLTAGTLLVDCKATTKKHGDFRGTLDTTITRLTWTSEAKAKAGAAA